MVDVEVVILGQMSEVVWTQGVVVERGVLEAADDLSNDAPFVAQQYCCYYYCFVALEMYLHVYFP